LREKTLEPNPDNGSLEEFDSAIKCARKEKEYVRLRAIRSLLLGIDRETVSLIFNVSDRSIQFWIHRFNESGIDGLFAKSRSGRPRSIPLEEMKEKITPVLENPEQENETHWTAKKLHSFLKKSFKVGLCYSTTLNYLHELDYKLKVPQRWPGKEDKEKKALFKRDLSELMKSPDAHFWFCDESGFEGDPRPTRRWAKRGSKPKLKYYGNHLRRSVIGAVCPQNGELFALIIDGRV
jgi:transposase